jgi:hypothetical protein
LFEDEDDAEKDAEEDDNVGDVEEEEVGRVCDGEEGDERVVMLHSFGSLLVTGRVWKWGREVVGLARRKRLFGVSSRLELVVCCGCA